MEKRKCEFCGELFESKSHQAKFCKKKECQKFRKLTYLQRKKYLKNHKIFTATTATTATKNKNSKIIIEKNLNGLFSDYKIITKYKDLAEKVVLLMNKTKIETYPKHLQAQCFSIIEQLENFLKKQYVIKTELGYSIKRGEIIDVEEDT